MKKGSFEESELEITMCELRLLSHEIAGELSTIQCELEKRGRWKEFMYKAASGDAEGNQPETCFESLHFVFSIVEHYENLAARIEETELLKGNRMETVAMPEDAMECLKSLGITIEPGTSAAPEIAVKDRQEKICIYYLMSRRVHEMMQTALQRLITSRISILERYR